MMRRDRDYRLMADINVTPLVDVMLVLLVIFMITAPLMQHGIDIELPQETTSAVQVSDKTPTISLKPNRSIYWDKDKVSTLPNLTEKLKRYQSSKKDGAIYFRADQSLDYGFVMKVMATIRRAGVQNIGMITEPEQ